MKFLIKLLSVVAVFMAFETPAFAVNDSFNTSLFNHGSRQEPRGTWHGAGVAIDLSRGQQVAVEYNGGSTCLEIVNGQAPSNFLMPTNTTQTELSRFLSAQGTSFRNCQNRYTAWDVASLSCPANMPCGTTEIVSRARQCERSIGRYVNCSECGGSCYEEISCSGDRCGGDGDGQGGGNACFPGSVKITMADGTEKAIADVKVGDHVLGFSENTATGVLEPVAVSYVKITPNQDIYSLNDGALEATGAHPIMRPDGSFTALNRLTLGDEIVLEDGSAMTVETLEFTGRQELVFNLVLENGTGFIAEGIRVQEDMRDFATISAYMELREAR